MTALNKPKREEVELAWKALALLDENERLNAMNEENNLVCTCGCAADDHEDYGEDGMGCDNTHHECVNTCPAVLHMLINLRDENEQLKLRLKTFDDERKRLRIVEEEIERLTRALKVVEAARLALEHLDNEPMTGAFEYAREAQAILREALAKLDGVKDA